MIPGQKVKLSKQAIGWIGDEGLRGEYIGESKYPGCIRVLVYPETADNDKAEWDPDGNSSLANFWVLI
jgi:hypothetical protein